MSLMVGQVSDVAVSEQRFEDGLFFCAAVTTKGGWVGSVQGSTSK